MSYHHDPDRPSVIAHCFVAVALCAIGLTILIAASGCTSAQVITDAVADGLSACRETTRADCEDAGVAYIAPSPDYPCGDCGPAPTPSPTPAPTVAPTPAPTPSPASWAPLTGGPAVRVDPSAGVASFALRGPMALSEREWAVFNLLDCKEPAALLCNGAERQQVHLMAWNTGRPTWRLICQSWAGPKFLEPHSGDHTETWDRRRPWELVVDWSKGATVRAEVYQDGGIRAVWSVECPAPWDGLSGFYLGDGVFPNYHHTGTLERKAE